MLSALHNLLIEYSIKSFVNVCTYLTFTKWFTFYKLSMCWYVLKDLHFPLSAAFDVTAQVASSSGAIRQSVLS